MEQKTRQLWLCLSNDLRGLNIEEMDGYEGFRLVDPATRQTMYTAYVSECGYSSYEAIADIHKGIDIADEILLAEKAPLFTAVAKIKSHHVRCCPELYSVAPPVNTLPQIHYGYRVPA
jgi:hypothetical protein